MYLKSLILKGFKSFADRSVLALEPGITAIVGPNGSGKSNISDAVLWVLGERNPRHLRGQAMEDVIFAGSSARKPAGLAEVDLVLDNSDNTLPVDFSEVVITRRMYRSGENEYLLNGTVVRRMDVLDILHDAGLGSTSHSIISQGSLDSILQSKPEDRRTLIEEAAGVLKHRQRKERSERKLATMDQHLARVKDVVGEVQRQLGPLERRAKKARTYEGLSEELADVSLKLAVDDLRRLQHTWDGLQEHEQHLTESLEEKKLLIDEAESVVEQLQENIRRQSVDAGQISRLHRRATTVAERLDSTMLVMRERQRAALSRSTEIQLSLDALETQRTQTNTEIHQFEATLTDARAAYATADALRSDLNSAFENIDAQRKALEQELSDTEADIQKFEAQIKTAQQKQAQTQEALTNGLAHMKVIEGHVSELELQVTRAQTDATSAADEVKAAQKALTSLDEQEADAKNLVDACTQAREAARTALDDARQAEQTLTAQIQALEEVERTNLALGGKARVWLAEHADDLVGEIEPLSKILQVHNGREALVESLLGSDVSLLLVDDAACARAVVSALCDAQQTGEVSLILRTDNTGDRAAEKQDVSAKAADTAPALSYPDDAPGTPLINDLEYPESASRVVVAVLGDVIVCSTLDDALWAHASDTRQLRFVSEDGSVVWSSGKVTFGRKSAGDMSGGERSADDSQSSSDSADNSNPFSTDEGVLARTRHIAELKQGLVDAHAVTEKAQSEAQRAEEALQNAQASGLELSQKLATLRGNAEAARSLAARAEEKLSTVQRELEEVELQRSDAQATISEARPHAEDYKHQISELQNKLDEAIRRQDETEAALKPLRDDTQQKTGELADAKLEATKLAERVAYLEQTLASRKRELEQLIDQTNEEAGLQRVKKTSAQRLESLFTLFDELIRSAQNRMQGLEQRSEAAQDTSSDLYTQVNEARANSRAAHSAYDEVNEQLSEARVDKGRLELQVETAVNVIEKDCSTPLEVAFALPELEDRPKCEEDAFRLRRRIANLGTINPDAANEYDEIKTRYDYLTSQLDDMQAARKSLAQINRVIDARMREDFVRTFDQVNDAFCDIFSTLFPGGTAHLSLVDPDDVDNTGIEVNAQPAGKRIAKMTLLSGGEKSLTALALLFAVYRTCASPFYILDEVEAALDDTNLRRLMGFIDQLRDSTQLIMITHQRRTMELADVLFGVSMQADGVTKVVSQRL